MSKIEAYLHESNINVRRNEVTNIMKKYKDRIPIIVKIAARDSHKLKLDRNKYLCPIDLTFSQFMLVVRKRLNLKADESIFFFVNNILPPLQAEIREIYDQYHLKCGFLLVTVCCESTFGA